MLLIVCSRKVVNCAMLCFMKTKPLIKSARLIFSENLRKLRLEQGISQEQLAEMADLHRTYIGSVERGERNISVDNMQVLANALNVALKDML